MSTFEIPQETNEYMPQKWMFPPDFGYYRLFSLPHLIAVFLSVSSLMEYLILFHKHIELYRPQSYK